MRVHSRVISMANAKIKDEHPQFLRMLKTESAANTFTEQEFPTPVPIAVPNNRYMVMNILKIFIQPNVGDMGDGDAFTCAVYDRTRSGMPGMADPGVLAVRVNTAKLTTSGAHNVDSLTCVDLSDGAGHGVLYAKSKIYIAIQGTSQSGALGIRVAILYTLTELTPEEYIGLVDQS